MCVFLCVCDERGIEREGEGGGGGKRDRERDSKEEREMKNLRAKERDIKGQLHRTYY